MKRLIRITCDGPGCACTLTVENRGHVPVVPAWLTVHRLAAVEAGTPVYAEAPVFDFCSVACLRAFLELVHGDEGLGGMAP